MLDLLLEWMTYMNYVCTLFTCDVKAKVCSMFMCILLNVTVVYQVSWKQGQTVDLRVS